jgi:5-methylthioadenosine/S-adenosylhomocysteine deaminase
MGEDRASRFYWGRGHRDRRFEGAEGGNGYQALALADAGWLAPGNKADLIMVDLRKAHLVPLLRVVSSFVHQGQAGDVEAVMVDGQWLMRDGIVLTMDEEHIVQEADRIGRAAWQRVFEERPDLKE